MDAATPKPEDDEEATALEPPRLQRRRDLRDDPDRDARGVKWQEENAEAIAAYTVWFEATGHKFLRRLQF